MTMPRGVSRALYAGNGQAVRFPFLFKVWEEDQLSVLVTSPDGVTSEATGWSAELDEGGGTLIYLHNGAPLPEGWKLAIMRDMPFVQEVDLITGTRFDPEVIETALDVATAERQQLLERLARAIVVEPTDEAGPEALLADIMDARATASASAVSAEANANAAAESARGAAGSCALATEQREAACVCAGEALAARDAAVAQAEAANALMEAELAKVNAIVAANRTDQQAAVTAAQAWAEKAPDVPVDYDDAGNPRYSARHWAENAQKIAIEPPTAVRRGAIRVGPGLRLETGDNGETDVLAVALAEIGGCLLLNEEQWITASGTFTAPVGGWYSLLLFGGGQSGAYDAVYKSARSGQPGAVKSALVHLEEGQEVAVTIGAGGPVPQANDGHPTAGGATRFGDIATPVSAAETRRPLISTIGFATGNLTFQVFGQGIGGGNCILRSHGSVTSQADGNQKNGATGHFGGSGAATTQSGGDYTVGPGAPGSIRVRWHNPAKAAGPAAAPALLAARRRAAPLAAEPVTVNLYDPETGLGSVWRAEEAEAGLGHGLISEAAWLAICAARAAEARAAWLADPDTEAERFELLRRARDAKLAATDYLLAPDSPLTDEQRASVTAYRQALRDLPAQEGAPWDGGGEATPWPVRPALGADAEEPPCA